MQFEDSPEVLARFSAELALVDMVAGQLRRELGPLLDTQEMLCFGREGLLDAARRYDPERGIPFRKYANYRVRGMILDGMRSTTGLSRRAYEKVKAFQSAVSTAEGMSEDTTAQLKLARGAKLADDRLNDQLAAMATAMALGFGTTPGVGEEGEAIVVDETLGPEQRAEQNELYEMIRIEVDGLPESERKLIRRHFFDDIKLDAASKELGLSKSWGSRVLARAMVRLSKRLSQAEA